MGKMKDLAISLKDQQMSVDSAKGYLKERGYYMDNLWTTRDITDRFRDCSDEEAYEILDSVLQSEYIITMINETLCEHAVEISKLKFKDD
tara:strand:- start:48 stop:317 length:270 start_codon:yes stop_codon:yes gene_type:complete